MTTTITSPVTSAHTTPLTTLFTPPDSCTSQSWVSSDCLGSTCERIYNIVRKTESECYPSGWEPTATLLSPGTLCPSGYSMDTSSLVYYGARSIETQGTCCPSGFTVETSSSQAWYKLEPCVWRSTGTTIITYTVVGATPTSTTVVTYPTPLIHAIPVGIAWQSSDLISPSTTNQAPTADATADATTDATSNPTQTDTPAASGTGLSTGAKAGIGVGVSVGVIAIALVLAFLLCFRRKKEKDTAPSVSSRPPVELPNERGINEQSGLHELDGMQRGDGPPKDELREHDAYAQEHSTYSSQGHDTYSQGYETYARGHDTYVHDLEAKQMRG